ncbi:GFA family protein [Novosphingopyxis sp.]|uniref:GFA family protein n=1 Tax=Novosphingopyxis sp. TaxID=2709690 RepID=UPI003B596A59
MSKRIATCFCEQLKVTCSGEPVRVSVCHCLNCQKRSGSSFAAQARWPNEQVDVEGLFKEYARRGDNGSVCTFRFCPNCGGTISYQHEEMPDLTAVPIGAFADPSFLPPQYSVYEQRAHAWVSIVGEGIEHYD